MSEATINPFKVTAEVQSKVISNMLVTAFETDYCSWLFKARLLATPVPKEEFDVNWYGTPKVFEHDFKFLLVVENHESDDPETLEIEVTPEKVQKGLDVLNEKYHRHIADMLAENDDAETADSFLQCVVYGDLIYG